MSAAAQILVLSDFPDEAHAVAQALRELSRRTVREATDLSSAGETTSGNALEIIFAHLQAGAVAATGFLNEAWKLNPKSTRFLLGDSTVDAEALVRCALGPHQFICTPIDPDKLAGALARADAIKRYVRDEKIQ